MHQMYQNHRSNIIIQGGLKKNENELQFVGRVALRARLGELPDNLLTHRIPATSNGEKNEK